MATALTAPAAHADRFLAFERAVLAHVGATHRVAIALTGDSDDASDLGWETFLRAYRHWQTFDLDADARRWLATICRNAWRSNATSRKGEAVLDEEMVDFLPAARLHLEAVRWLLDDLYERFDLADAISRAIDALDLPFRQVVLLCDVEDHSYAEVAEALGIPLGTVRSRLYRARDRSQSDLLAWAQDAGRGLPPTSPES